MTVADMPPVVPTRIVLPNEPIYIRFFIQCETQMNVTKKRADGTHNVISMQIFKLSSIPPVGNYICYMIPWMSNTFSDVSLDERFWTWANEGDKHTNVRWIFLCAVPVCVQLAYETRCISCRCWMPLLTFQIISSFRSVGIRHCIIIFETADG